MTDGRQEVSGLVAHLFRHQSGRLVALLTRAFGARHLSLAEDAVQEALVAALHTWPLRGVPDNPPAWLLQVSRRKALDVLRRGHTFTHRVESALIAELDRAATAPERDVDDALGLMFLTCHPDLSLENSLALTLKVVGGFSVDEIARLLLADPRAVAQRLVRTKHRLRDLGTDIEVPPTTERGERLTSVLEAIGLMFTSGYGPRDGTSLVREDVCFEAVRLARLLTQHPATSVPASHALCALLLFQAARLPSRLTQAGDLAVFERQDRSRWLWPLIHEGHHHLDAAASGTTMTHWHLQAGIAALHVTAQSADAIPWSRILPLYDDLLQLRPSGIVALNRAIAIGMSEGWQAGLQALTPLADDGRLQSYHLLHAARGHFLEAGGQTTAARAAFTEALSCATSAPERRFLQARLTALTQ
jgi:RNA polymerase sigma-70 factor, ECF subfamily